MSSNALTVVEPVESTKKFKFHTEKDPEKIEITIPELLESGYAFHVWPSASVLAWFLWIQRKKFTGKRILEIGCGTALPGILAAKFGASVILSDCCSPPTILRHVNRCCAANDLVPGRDIDVIGLNWGLLLKSVFDIGPLDYIIAADCFYEPSDFENILVTISFLLKSTGAAASTGTTAPVKFLFTYQERTSDLSIEYLLKKWQLQCSKVSLDCVEKLCPIDLDNLMKQHTVHLLEITKSS